MGRFVARLAALSLIALCSVQPGATRAVTLNHFRAPESGRDSFALSRPLTLQGGSLGFALHADYSRGAFISPGVERQGDEFRSTLGLSYGIADSLSFSLGLPGAISSSSPLASEAGVGDPYVGLRWRFAGSEQERDDVFMALQVVGHSDVADSPGLFTGGETAIHPELLLEYRVGNQWNIFASSGVMFKPNSAEIALPLGPVAPGLADFVPDFQKERDVWTGALGASRQVALDQHNPLRSVDLHFQAFGQTEIEGELFAEESASPLEGLVGVQAHNGAGWTLGAAVSRGLTNGFGAPDLRAMVSAGYAAVRITLDADRDGIKDARDKCPSVPEDHDGYQDGDGCPESGADTDRDKILDENDECRQDAEDYDGFQDEDGCPEPDDDEDGFEDANDKCPREPEDLDRFEDNDGCPDFDNDGDKILDVQDRCPNRAGPAFTGGCPDEDQDEDGLVDRLDNCPTEPGPKENFGCKAKQLVSIEGCRIDLKEKVFFATGKAVIQRVSFPLLDNVASVLKGHAEIQQVRVEGHTDSQGGNASNLSLSQRRAASVVNYLLGKKVETKLDPVGFGEGQPIADNGTREGRALNRRVEFVMVGCQAPAE